MDRVVVTAPPKLNLCLDVGPRTPDGYHPITSLMVALDGIRDVVTVTGAPQRTLSCPGFDDPSNLAWRAVDVLERHAGRALPCHVAIDKQIPAQAGLGGGSSDGAATLVAVNALFRLGLDVPTLQDLAARLGSDVPFFVRGGCQWATGRGERVVPAEAPPFAAIIVVPPVGLATPRVYRAFDEHPPPARTPDLTVPATTETLMAWVRNDLWAPARSLAPELVDVESVLTSCGAGAVVLCGSGSGVAGLFATERDARRARPAVVERLEPAAWVSVVSGPSRPRVA